MSLSRPRVLARRRTIILAAAIVGVLALAVSAAGGSPAVKKTSYAPPPVITASDTARAKLEDTLLAKVDAGSKATVTVHAVLSSGSVATVRKYFTKSWVARHGDVAILLGTTTVPKTLKIAGTAGVATIDLADFSRTGEPADIGDEEKRHRHRSGRHGDKNDVPYSEAPAPRESRFDKVKTVDLLDAKTHDFRGAWAAGYDGTGVTVGVLDGGTDFAHPDLLNTWKTWDAGPWAGWPMAFDPYGTLVLLAAPERVALGLTFYTPTQAAGACVPVKQKKADPEDDRHKSRSDRGTCTVELATRTGPARNFAAPDGTVSHTYKLKSAWSKSGTFRFGSHPDEYLLASNGERPAFVVADSSTAGVYDTVYVDLDDDQDFTDEKPVTKSSPASYRDMNGDGYTDISGGLLAFISDGATPLPGGVTEFLPSGDTSFVFGSGEMLMWTGDFDPGIEGHGTLTASNIVGQGVARGGAPEFSDLDEQKYPGVIGGAPEAKLAPYSDIYFGFDFSTQFGYYLSIVNGLDITSNSYGTSETDNDGFDAASNEADIWHRLLPDAHTVPLFSTGNGAPGYGTRTAPQPTAGIAVGASTQFGGTGWDSIARTSQIVDNDVIEWSNRGPGANGSSGVDVVADGAFSPGDLTLNTVGDGRIAWASWGGTSRSTPVAAGAAALVVQAYKKAGGTPGPGFFNTVRRALKSSANDLGYDSFTQGAGSIDAARAVKAAAGQSIVVSPDKWRAGAPVTGGSEWLAFPNTITAGGSSTRSFAVSGGSPTSISDRSLTLADSEEFPLTSSDQSNESPYTFQAPDYLFDLTQKVKAHRDADLLVIRVNFARSALDPNGDYAPDQAWRLLPYNWTDIDHDGRLWRDKDGDGVVDHTATADVDIDQHPIIDYRKSEIEEGEYVRFMYHRPDHNALVSYVRRPGKRMADGLFLGLQHSIRDPNQATTAFTVRLEWYKNTDWQWLSTNPTASGFDATLNVPADTAPGMYQGAVVVGARDGSTSVVPVTAAVAPTMQQDAKGRLSGSLTFGGNDVAAAQSNLTYNNGSVFGASDWTWRAESGDWRFFFFNVAEPPAPGSLLLAQTSWDDPGPSTDVDTLVMGPSVNDYSNGALDLLFGSGAGNFYEGALAPYVLGTTGASANAYLGTGIWGFNTSTGSNSDVVASPVSPDGGLHSIVWHQVGWDGGKFDVPVKTTLSSASVEPSSIVKTVTSDAGQFAVSFSSGADPGIVSAQAFGLGDLTTTTESLSQDNQDDITTSSVKRTITVSHASRVEISVDAADSNDTDLYVLHNGQVVASSATGSADEAVTLILPEDGQYDIWVHGFAVNPSPSPIQLTVKRVQGTDLTANVVQNGNNATITVNYNKVLTPGRTYYGELLLGPASAPQAISVPIEITRAGP